MSAESLPAVGGFRRGIGGGGLGGKDKGKKIYSLAYADDVAVVAEDEDEMRRMLKNLEKYMDGKGLEINVEKTKVMRCRRREKRWKKVE